MDNFKNLVDVVSKFKRDLARYRADNNTYNLLDCFLDLNSIPEWIINTPYIDPDLAKIAKEKSEVFKGSFQFDETLIEKNIDHQIKLIRMICNSAKHNSPNEKIPSIIEKYGTTLPARLPAKFQMCVFIGDKDYDAEILLESVGNFWMDTIDQYL